MSTDVVSGVLGVLDGGRLEGRNFGGLVKIRDDASLEELLVIDLISILDVLSDIGGDNTVLILDVIIFLVRNHNNRLVVPGNIGVLPSSVTLSGVDFDSVNFVHGSSELSIGINAHLGLNFEDWGTEVNGSRV